MKPLVNVEKKFCGVPAAFGRLCVETALAEAERFMIAPQPPSGGCVLKPRLLKLNGS